MHISGAPPPGAKPAKPQRGVNLKAAFGPEVGSKLTGRHLSLEIFPFDYCEFLAFTGRQRGTASLLSYLHDGGFPSYLRNGKCTIHVAPVWKWLGKGGMG